MGKFIFTRLAIITYSAMAGSSNAGAVKHNMSTQPIIDRTNVHSGYAGRYVLM